MIGIGKEAIVANFEVIPKLSWRGSLKIVCPIWFLAYFITALYLEANNVYRIHLRESKVITWCK